MSSEKVSYDEADNSRVGSPHETPSAAESGVDVAYEKKIM